MHPQREDCAPAPWATLQPIVMRTFCDYGEKFSWFAHCTSCAHDRLFSTEDITRLFGPDADVDRARARLRCTRCASRECLLYRYYRSEGERAR